MKDFNLETVTTATEQAIFDLFGNLQDRFGIKYGDIFPDDAFELDDIQEKLSLLVYRVLSYEMGIGEEEDEE